MHTGQTLVFGSSPNAARHPQKHLRAGQELDVDLEADERRRTC